MITTLYCSFCGKSQHEVRKLVAGPGRVFICNECVDLCHDIVHPEAASLTVPRSSSSTSPPPLEYSPEVSAATRPCTSPRCFYDIVSQHLAAHPPVTGNPVAEKAASTLLRLHQAIGA